MSKPTRSARIIALLKARLENGERLSQADISRIVGVSREYVRQIELRHFGKNGRERQKHNAAVRKADRRIPHFSQLVKSWLALIDYKWCGVCRSAKPSEDMSKGDTSRRCKACNAANARLWYQKNTEKVKQWTQANADKIKQYHQRYNAKPEVRERRRQRARAYREYHQRKKTQAGGAA